MMEDSGIEITEENIVSGVGGGAAPSAETEPAVFDLPVDDDDVVDEGNDDATYSSSSLQSGRGTSWSMFAVTAMALFVSVVGLGVGYGIGMGISDRGASKNDSDEVVIAWSLGADAMEAPMGEAPSTITPSAMMPDAPMEAPVTPAPVTLALSTSPVVLLEVPEPAPSTEPAPVPSTTSPVVDGPCFCPAPAESPISAPTPGGAPASCGLPVPPAIAGEGSLSYCSALVGKMCSNKERKICASNLHQDLITYHGRYGIRYTEALIDGAGDLVGSLCSIPLNIIDPEDGPFDDVTIMKCLNGFDKTTQCLIQIRALTKIEDEIMDAVTVCNDAIKIEWANRCSGKAYCRSATTGRIVHCPNFTRVYGFSCPSGDDIRARPECNFPNPNPNKALQKPAICTK